MTNTTLTPGQKAAQTKRNNKLAAVRSERANKAWNTRRINSLGSQALKAIAETRANFKTNSTTV
jgi:hypothetical protein